MTSTVEEDYYDVLELKKDATVQDIKLNYHRLARIRHPDKDRSHDMSVATAVFQTV